MRRLFKEHMKKSSEEIEAIWKDCIFVFDANIYLNLYRYSEDTKKQTLGIINKVNDDVRAPFQVIKEYLENRNIVIIDEDINLNSAIKDLENLAVKFKNERENPFLSKKTLDIYLKATDKVKSEIQDNIKSNISKISNDTLLNDISNLLENKVLEEYSYEEKLEIFKEGIIRYNKKIPPGYEDSKKIQKFEEIKEKDIELKFDSLENVFGDLLVWLQTIKIAKDNDRNIIFVSDDVKPDWISQEKGKKTGPRPELIKEFQEKTNKEIIIYNFLNFLSSYSEYREKVSNNVISEVRNSSENTFKIYKENYGDLENEILKVIQSESGRVNIEYLENKFNLKNIPRINELLNLRKDLKRQLLDIESSHIESSNLSEFKAMEEMKINSFSMVSDRIKKIEHEIQYQIKKHLDRL